MLKSITRVGLIAVALWNIHAFTTMVLTLPARDVDATVQWEKAWEPIHHQLIVAGYRIGDLGYVTARTLRGEPLSETEDIRRAELYYVVIPLNLVRSKVDTPFVLADFTVEKPKELPPNLTVFYDPGNGLVLLKSTVKQ